MTNAEIIAATTCHNPQRFKYEAIHFGWLDQSDHTGIDFFYDKQFNGGKRICPDCKQGLLRLERPGKEGCSFC